MSVLACASNANPTTYYWAEAGQGAATTIQSPVVVLPDGATDASLSVNAGSAAGDSTLSVVAGANGSASFPIGGGGTVYTIAVPGTAGGASQGHLQIDVAPGQVGQTPVLDYNAATGSLILGDSLPGSQVQIDASKLLVSAAPFNGNAVEIQSVTATSGAILNTCASEGGLSLGSSAAFPSTMLVADVTGTAKVGIGGNAGSTILLTGGAGASQTSIINTSATGVGSLLLGASAVNDRAIFINDTGGGANSAVVDITGGTATGVALRLRGYGAGSAAIISTNAGAGGVLNIQNNVTEASPNMVMTDASTTLNGLVLVPNDLSFVGSGSITAFQTFVTSGVSCGDNTTAGIPNPSGLAIGLYMVLARGTIGGVSSVACSVSTVSYWDGSSWKWGGGGAAPALVTAPPSYIGILGGGATLVLANGGGLGTATMDFTYLKLGGNLGI